MTEPLNPQYWIEHLNLQPHPEGGFYREMFRSAIGVARVGETAIKQASTSIYYLLEGNDYSGFHRLRSDEIWYFHKGQPLYIHAINEAGEYKIYVLSDEAEGHLSIVIPAGVWFAAEVPSKAGFVLVSCTVAPGFDFAEFEMAGRERLGAKYPQYTEVIGRLCRC